MASVSDPRGELTARMRELDRLVGRPKGPAMAAMAALGGDQLPEHSGPSARLTSVAKVLSQRAGGRAEDVRHEGVHHGGG